MANSARDRLVEATSHLLETQGYHATGLSQILQESGAPRGSLYYYFPGGKEGLAAEAVRHKGRVVRERFRRALEQHDDPAEAVPHLLRTLSGRFADADCRGGTPIAAVALESSAISEEMREVCREVYRDWQALFYDKLTASGFSDARSRRLASLIVSGLEGAIVLSRTEKSPQPLVDLADELELLLRTTSNV